MYQMFSGMYIYNTHIVVVKRIGFVAVVYITILSIEAYWFLVVNYKNAMFGPPPLFLLLFLVFLLSLASSYTTILLKEVLRECCFNTRSLGFEKFTWVEIGVPVSIISISSESSISTIWESSTL